MAGFVRALERAWYRPHGAWPWLKPLAWLFGAVVALRRRAYDRGWLSRTRVGVPVLVVGNITVGGSGKTPLTLAIIEQLRVRGRRPGVVSRGYGGRAASYPLTIGADTPTAAAGDEPVLIARRSGVPVVVDPDRVRAARRLVDDIGVDCIVADDGLQHYRLARDAEIAVVDARRGLGNGWLLPAGPLREPASRLDAVDLVLRHGQASDFRLVPGAAICLAGGQVRELARFAETRAHAVAGIGDPTRFFDMLRAHGLDIVEHPMPDHHAYTAEDLTFGDDAPVLMTEKDSVKCAAFARAHHWYLPVDVALSAEGARRLNGLLDRFAALPGTAS